MAKKRSYRDDIIRFGSLFIAILIFFIGPRFVKSDLTKDIDSTIEFISKAKLKASVAAPILEQLRSDKKFVQENTEKISLAGINMGAVYWLAFIIVIVGWAGPFLIKWRQNKNLPPAPPGVPG
jgi:hypothetical protein